jgi:hypothetical protein
VRGKRPSSKHDTQRRLFEKNPTEELDGRQEIDKNVKKDSQR